MGRELKGSFYAQSASRGAVRRYFTDLQHTSRGNYRHTLTSFLSLVCC